MSALLIRRVEVDGRIVDVSCRDGVVDSIAASVTPAGDDQVLDGAGGALIPGLHDHHLHLLATAAAAGSVPVGPPAVMSAAAFAEVLRRADAAAAAGSWIRAVGYHESVAGDLDRDRLDALVPHRPVRVQHRSGAAWFLNSAACDAVGLADGPAGVERDGTGRPTGRLVRADDWLRERLPARPPPDVVGVCRALASFGVTGCTDATPFTDLDGIGLLAGGPVLQRLQVMGGPSLSAAEFPAGVQRGPVKVVVADHDLPTPDHLAAWFRSAHDAGRAVAVHCVSRIALVVALAAWEGAGAVDGDRIEHASVVPPELIGAVAALGLRVVTQPNFVVERGDRYLADVDGRDVGDLYRCRSLLDAGVAVAGGTDAPFGDPDPWRAVAGAVSRRTSGGQVLGPDEGIDAETALGLFLSPLDDPGGAPRCVRVGAPADLALLRAPLREALAAPSSELVAATIIAGRVVFEG